jgi:hypothetical protein
MPYIFLDESGQFTKHNNERYFVVGSFTVGNPRRTEKQLPQLPQGSLVQIEMIDSASNPNIQIADWISGALARYLEEKNLGNDCYQILKNNLLSEGKELFKDYWENKYKNKNPNRSN